MKKDDDILKEVISMGSLGSMLIALLTKEKKATATITVLGLLASVAILASYKASKKALQTNLPILFEEDNILYELQTDGSKKIIKTLPKASSNIPGTFTLK